MTKAELRAQLVKDIAAYVGKGGKVTTTPSKAPRKGELLNAVSANAKAGRWYRGGVASTHDARWSANNAI
tara:strand:+ start:126 stop:335 length:210 start_codon:yes stop_codon:yes gene_type:complete